MMPRPLIEPRKHDSIVDDSILLKQMTTYKRVATKHLKERHYKDHDLKRVTEDSTEEEGSPKVFFVFNVSISTPAENLIRTPDQGKVHVMCKQALFSTALLLAHL